MVTQYHFDRDRLNKLFADAHHRDDIIAAMKRPAESLPWYRYRKIFLTTSRTSGGVRFWQEYADTLARAERVYGVPPEIVTAIIGVESRYGAIQGGYPVIDALATLGFDYPPRADFFRKELRDYLLLSRDQKFDPAEMQGSYAGALGAPQFIASSYRRYAVDFDGNGTSDLWDDWKDIIGSVANYFAENGWQRGGRIVVPATLKAGATAPEKTGNTTVGALRQAGFTIDAGVADSADAVLISLDTGDGQRYWVGLHNFVVITRYNHSPLYAMAIFQLGNAIARDMPGTSAANDAAGR